MSTRWTSADLASVRSRLYGPEGQLPSRKYRNQPQREDGHNFASKAEVRRYFELKTMQAAKLISELKVHPEFALHSPDPNGIPRRVCAYIADFSYQRDGKLVIEDCKSSVTRVHSTYQLKRRMIEAEYGISVVEILRGGRG
jgi:hypothetical protein